MSSVYRSMLFSGRKERLLRAFIWLNLIHPLTAWNKIPTFIYMPTANSLFFSFEIPLYGFVIESCIYFFSKIEKIFFIKFFILLLETQTLVIGSGLLPSRPVPFPWTYSFESDATFLPHTGLWLLPCGRAPHLESQLAITVPRIWREKLRLCPHPLLLCLWACP